METFTPISISIYYSTYMYMQICIDADRHITKRSVYLNAKIRTHI